MTSSLTTSPISTQPTTGSKTIPCKALVDKLFSLQNRILLRAARALFEDPRATPASHHEGLAGGVRTSENGLFLYQSRQAEWALRTRAMDYFLVFSSAGWLLGVSQLLLAPFIVACLSLPRKLASSYYFTFHAELLPHSEQVVFHKADFFGKVKRVTVDIKNLEKIEAETLPSKMIWMINMFD